jgi:hypothetical protein
MKRLIAGLLILSITLCGCGGAKTNSGSNGSFDNNEKSTAEETAVSEEEPAVEKEPEASVTAADIAGTYVGLHGSGITFLSNGTAEYFWKEWFDVETGDKWSFDGQRVTMHSNALEYDIYAEVTGESISTLNFQSDVDTWMDEMFVRVSDDAKSKDVDSYIALIEKQLNTKLERPSDTFEVHAGGFVLELPHAYKMTESNDTTRIYTKSDDTAILYVFGDSFDAETAKKMRNNKKKVEDVLEEKMGEIIEGITDVDDLLTSKKYTDGVKPQESIGNTYHYDISDGTYNARVYESWAYDLSTGGMMITLLIDLDPNYKNSEEYLDIIRNAVPEWQTTSKASADSASTSEKDTNNSKNSASNSSESKDSESKAGNSGGVDPELKAFLDSYEDFVDEYVEFMKKYQDDPSNAISMLSEYANIMQKYTDFAEKINKYDSNNLSTEDYKYYIEVTSRCAQKMLDIY